MVARRNQPLKRQLNALFVKVGSFYPMRENFRLTREVKAKFTGKLALNPRDFCGRKVKEVVCTDGLKLVMTARGCVTGFPAPSRWCVSTRRQ
jgi:phosphoglucomutase